MSPHRHATVKYVSLFIYKYIYRHVHSMYNTMSPPGDGRGNGLAAVETVYVMRLLVTILRYMRVKVSGKQPPHWTTGNMECEHVSRLLIPMAHLRRLPAIFWQEMHFWNILDHNTDAKCRTAHLWCLSPPCTPPTMSKRSLAFDRGTQIVYIRLLFRP